MEGYEPPTPQKPTRFGRFELLERVGTASTTEVFRARLLGPEGFSKTFAIKRVLPELRSDREVVRRFVEEAQLGATIDHNHIARLYELAQTSQGDYFMVMEWIDGISLERLLRQAGQLELRVPMWFTLYVVGQALEALSYLHSLVDGLGRSRNLICRDITPAKILVSDLGQVKLLSFGVMQSRHPSTSARQSKNPLAYMTPEQLRGTPLDARVDVFLMGVILWEMLTQASLFGHLNEIEAMLAICQSDRRLPSKVVSGLSPELDRVVLKALMSETEGRYPSVHAFQSDLAKILHEMRPPVLSDELHDMVEVLTGKVPPDDEIKPSPLAPPPPADRTLQDDERTQPPENSLPPLPMSALLSDEIPAAPAPRVNKPKKESYTEIAKVTPWEILESDLAPSPTREFEPDFDDLNESAPTALGEPVPLPSQEGQWTDTEPRAGEEDGASTLQEDAPFIQFHVKLQDSKDVDILRYERAMIRIRQAAYAGVPSSISVDGHRWIGVKEFAQLTWQDLWLNTDELRHNVTVVGDIRQRSLVGLFHKLSNDQATGQLTVFRSKSDEDVWFELHMVNGQPIKVVTHIPSMQLPALLIARGTMDESTVIDLVHAVVAHRRALVDLAKDRALDCLPWGVYMRERLIEMFRWRHGDFTFNTDIALAETSPRAFASSLMALLPAVVFKAHDVNSLVEALGPRVHQTLVATEHFDVNLDRMNLAAEHRQFVEQFRESRSTVQWLDAIPQNKKELLTYVYILLETDALRAR